MLEVASSKVAEAILLLIYIRSSNLGSVFGNFNRSFSWFFTVPLGDCQEKTSSLVPVYSSLVIPAFDIIICDNENVAEL
jgi:hypothetical protein